MILAILQHTPVWVFVLFAALVYLGALRMRANETPVWRLLLLPVAMTAFSLFGLVQTLGIGAATATAWSLVFAATLAAGWALPTRPGVQYSPATRTVHVPGSWLPLMLMMTIFCLRYAVAVVLAMHPALREQGPFVAGVAAVYGLSSGCFAARALSTWRSAFASRTAAHRHTAVA